VCDSFFIGNFITDDITDGNSPSAFLSSVKKTLTMVLQTEIALQKKKFPLEIYRRIYSVGECMQYRQTIFIDKCVGDCEIPTDLFRRQLVGDCEMCTKLL
jgi:hypothetical protein